MKSNQFLALFLCLSFSMVLFSQNDDVKKVQFQVRASLSSSSLAGEVDGVYGREKSKIGYNIGGVADISMGKNFYFQPGIAFSAKGSMMREMPVDNGTKVDMTMNALYIQVPVYFAYKLPINNWPNSFNVAMGPYLAYGVGGKITGRGVRDIDTFGDQGWANRADIGFGMELQFEMPKVVFIWGFEGGFATILKREYFNADFRNSNLYWGVGYKF